MTGDRLRELAAQMSETQVWDEADPPSWVGPTTEATTAWMKSRRLTPEAFVLLADAIDYVQAEEDSLTRDHFYDDTDTRSALLARFRALGDT